MTDKKKAGRWKPGESGNPKGKPPGTGEVAKLRAVIAERVPELLAAMMTRALAGDVGAARLLLERAIAPLKPAEQAVSLSLPDGEGLTAQGTAIVQAVATGEIAPGQGAALLTGLGALARIKEIEELEARMESIERTLKGRKP